ncbi:MAG TPA: thioesterase domain-containing protein, partial [Polyangiaceae bacterium]
AKGLVAYVVPADPAQPPSVAALKRSLEGSLPAYMIPARFEIVDALPLTANGKVDRSRLGKGTTLARPAHVAPREGVEKALAAIWQQVLAVPAVGADDDFFALGGHSILAVRLSALVAARFKRPLPLSSLLSNPTLASQAALLEGAAALPQNVVCLATAERASAAPPVVLVHPVGGNVLCYRDLARLLRPSGAAIYGIQADDADDDGAPSSLPAMAERYVQALRGVQPRGPYRLGGWSLGGFVAVEMARVLRAAGEEVSLLFVIDSRLPTPSAEPVSSARLLARFLGDVGGGTPIPASMEGHLTDVVEAHRWGVESGALPRELSVDAFGRMFRIFERNARALLRYPRPCFDTPAHAFVADAPFPGHGDDLPWGTVHRLAGDHYTLLRPPALDHIARHLLSLLAGS